MNKSSVLRQLDELEEIQSEKAALTSVRHIEGQSNNESTSEKQK
jgi:hypothetical protein